MCNVYCLQKLYEIISGNERYFRRPGIRTGPAQKISEGHQLCLGGKEACEGKGSPRAADGLGTAVCTVMLGAGAVIRVDCPRPL